MDTGCICDHSTDTCGKCDQCCRCGCECWEEYPTSDAE